MMELHKERRNNKERRSGIDRRRINPPKYTGIERRKDPEGRSGNDRRKGILKSHIKPLWEFRIPLEAFLIHWHNQTCLKEGTGYGDSLGRITVIPVREISV